MHFCIYTPGKSIILLVLNWRHIILPMHDKSISSLLQMNTLGKCEDTCAPQGGKQLATRLWRVSFLLTVILTGLCSCSHLRLPLLPEKSYRTQASAEQSFLNGDFQEALLEFEQIYDTALSPDDKNTALYGMACTQMILAQNDDQLVESLTTLQRWNANKGSSSFDENRNLLLLALKQQSERIQEKKQKTVAHDKRQRRIIYSQKKKISQMATTVKQLKQQLDELEAIDEVFQEKRKP